MTVFETGFRRVILYQIFFQATKRAAGGSFARPAIDPLDLVRLTGLMSRSAGRRQIRIGLIDGPVAMDHAELVADRIEPVADARGAACGSPSSAACAHGTFVAGIVL